MFSSCLETIEPDGLSDLRGAKADLLRAQTALQEAQAAKVNAEAALKLAEAKVQEAIAAQEAAKVAIIEAEALLAQYQAEYQALVNAAYEAEKAFELEQAMAAAEAAKAAAELEAQKAAAQLELDLLDIQTQIIEAQAAYDHALKDLAAAKVTLSDGQKAYLLPFELAVYGYEDEVEQLTADLEDAAEDLKDAVAVVDKNKADKRAIHTAEKAVATAEAALEGAQENVALAEAALEIDPFVADWAEQLQALYDEYDAMIKAEYEGALEHEAAAQEWREAVDALVEEYEKYEDATGYAFNETTGQFSIYPIYNPARVWVPETYVAAPVDEEGNALFGGDFYIAPEDIYFRYGDTEYADNIFTDRIEDLETNTPEIYEAQIEGYEAQIETYNSDVFFQAELERYNDAVAAYNDGKIVEYMQKHVNEEFDPQAAVDEFNAAVKAFEAALADFDAEWEKYYPENNTAEAVAEIEKTHSETVDAARQAYVKARQTALDTKNAADVEYQKAVLAYQRAERAYNAVIDAAYEVTGIYGADALKAAIDQYKADKKAAADANDTTFDADGELAKANAVNETQLGLIEKAQAAFNDGKESTTTDAVSAFEAAQKKWDEAVAAYNKTVNEAEKTYYKALAEADQVRDDAFDDLNVGGTLDLVDDEYYTYLIYKVNEAAYVLDDAINKVDANDLRWYDYTTVRYETTNGMYARTFWTPDYLTEATLEGNVFVSPEVEDIIDPEWFYSNELSNVAGNLLTVRLNGYAYGYDVDGNWQFNNSYSYTYYLTDYDGFPLAMPEAEAIEENISNFENWVTNSIKNNFYNTYGTDPMFAQAHVNDASAVIMVPELETGIENCETAIANLELLPDFIAAIEAAHADFQKFVAEYEAEIDAIRPVVEENWMKYMDELTAMEDAMDIVEAKYDELDRTMNTIENLLANYIGTTDVEVYVAGLEEAYADAVEAVAQAEFDLEDAKADLESVMAGGEDAITDVEMAQKAYDKINEELTEALANLAAAAEALQDAMVAVGAAEATPAE